MINKFKKYIYMFLFFSCAVTMEHPPDGAINLFAVEGDSLNGQESRNGHISGVLLSNEAAFFYENQGYEWSIKQEGREEELSSITYQSKKIQMISSDTLPLSRNLIIGEKVKSGTYNVVLSIYTLGKVKDEDFLLRRFKRKILIDN